MPHRTLSIRNDCEQKINQLIVAMLIQAVKLLSTMVTSLPF